MSELQVEVSEGADGVTLLSLSGALDKRTSGELEKQLNDLLGGGRLKFVVDCAGLERVSSDGMGVFLSVLIKLRKGGGDIKFCAMRSEVQTVVSLLGLERLLVVKPTRDDAIAEFAASPPLTQEHETQKLRIDHDRRDDVSLLSLHGFVDRHTIQAIDRALAERLDQGQIKVVIDCGELSYVSSNGMGVFISYVSKARRLGGDIRFCCLRDVARTVVTMLGLDKHFEVFETQSEALASFAA